MNNYLIPLGKNIIKFRDHHNDPRSVSMHWPYAFVMSWCFINIQIQKDANEQQEIFQVGHYTPMASNKM